MGIDHEYAKERKKRMLVEITAGGFTHNLEWGFVRKWSDVCIKEAQAELLDWFEKIINDRSRILYVGRINDAINKKRKELGL